MQLDILAVGRMKSGPEQELLARYLGRAEKAGRQLGLNGPHLQEFPESREPDTSLRKVDEAEKLSIAAEGAILVALDEHGKHMNSPEFANLLRLAADKGEKRLCFAIGGPDGHGEAVLRQARHTIAFGKPTWPHQIARILLAEQIYRAMTIMSGHPYHRN